VFLYLDLTERGRETVQQYFEDEGRFQWQLLVKA
jgi:hypothetical protein